MGREHHLILKSILVSIVFVFLFSLAAPTIPTLGDSHVTLSEALVLVNTNSPGHQDFIQYIQPYLDHFGVPYSIADISLEPLPANLSSYALIIVGHNQLDVTNAFLTPAAQQVITDAVNQGSGLVNFDSALVDGNLQPRYQYAQDIFNFSYFNATSASSVSIQSNASIGNYVVALQASNTNHALLGNILPLGVVLPPQAESLAQVGGQPFLVATTLGQGRALQWTSYAWIQNSIYGYLRGLDDLVWRGLVWAARKPFVMQGLPPFLTMRVDDVAGPLWWVSDAVSYGFKPWLGIFLDNISDAEAAEISAQANSGQVTTAIHAFNESRLFYETYSLSDSLITASYNTGTQWHQAHNIPISQYVVPHVYRFGTNAFAGLSNWGVQFVGTHMTPGNDYRGSPWLMLKPYRLYQNGNADSSLPVYYADFITVPGHPEFNGQFLNCVTEIRDVTGYEWNPSTNVALTIERGTRQTKRALDSMVVASLFTHENNILPIPSTSWRAALEGILNQLASYEPILVTVDYACQYARAMYTSTIDTSSFDPAAGILQTTLTGSSDLPTTFYLFTEQGGAIQKISVDVPVFAGATTVTYALLPGQPTATATAGPSMTPTNTPTNTSTPTRTSTPLVTSTPAATPTQTSTPTVMNTPTATPTPTNTLPPDVIFADGFESGNMSAWSASRTDGEALSVTSAAALVGSYGLRASIADNTHLPIYVRDDSPNGEAGYRARFHFDPNSIPMAAGDAHVIFRGYTNTSITVSMEFGYINGSYQVRVNYINDNNWIFFSNWLALSDAPHPIELEWQAATGAGANNGSLTVWIDGSQRARLTGIDNDTRPIDYVLLGTLAGIDPGTRGAYSFDHFESFR